MTSVRSVSVPPEYEAAWETFEEIAKREKGKRGLSELLNEIVAAYAKKHGEGNDTYKLDKFDDPAFVAIPAMGEMLTPDRLDKVEIGDLEEWYFNAKARMQELDAALARRKAKIRGKQHISRPIPHLG